MWPFSSKADSPSRDALRTLTGRLEDLESDHRRVRAEWEDALDRFERIMGRLNKRAKRDGEQPDAPPPPADDVPLHLRHLDPVSRQIHAQRRARFSPTNGGKP